MQGIAGKAIHHQAEQGIACPPKPPHKQDQTVPTACNSIRCPTTNPSVRVQS